MWCVYIYICVCVCVCVCIYCPAPLPDPALLTQPLEPILILKSLTYFAPTCQRLHTLETCWGYRYSAAANLSPLPGEPQCFLRHRPLSSGKPIPGCPALGKEKRTQRTAPHPPTPIGSWSPSRPLRIGDLNPTDSLLIG